MEQADQRDREIAGLRERLLRLSEATLSINESRDLDTVLQGVLDSARSLTLARYGAMTLVDDAGGLLDIVFSGVTVQEAQRFHEMPDGVKFLEYLNAIPDPLRVPDLNGHFRAMGLPDFLPPLAGADGMSFLLTPILHRGERAGTFYLAEKDGGQEFTQEDEETLALFASQGALAISNARRHKEERRAWDSLETLINTSPVGVVVFDAKNGAPVSLNREAMRIMDNLCNPGQMLVDLLGTVTFQRADGREISLEEFPMAQLLSAGETVRAEVIVLKVPDGRSVTAMLNATPVRSEEGEVDSFIVALQDMTPLEEQERLRAEFLGMISQELRTPLATIKGSTEALLNDSPEMDAAVVNQFHRIIDQQVDHLQDLIGNLLDAARVQTGTLSVEPGPANVVDMVDEAKRRLQSGGARSNLEVDLPQGLPPVMADKRRIVQVLSNLLSNAANYSPEGSPIRVSAVSDGVFVSVSVADEGRGVPPDLLPHLFQRFSQLGSAEGRGAIGGSGLRLAICKGIVEAHGGRIWVESDGPGTGARFTFTVPVLDREGMSGAATRASSSFQADKPATERVRILLVDDDPHTLRYVRDALLKAGYEPIATGDPNDVLRLVEEERPDLILLDMILPGSDGIELMQDILDIADIPVIFLSAYGQDSFVARALDLGASDYVVKPFSPAELVARIRAALRRSAAPEQSDTQEPYSAKGLSIDYAGRRVSVAGRSVRLTPTEYLLLHELSLNAGRVLTHDHLIRVVWGRERIGEPRLLRDVVKRLRRKLGDDADKPTYIFTEPRIGYFMTGE